VAAEGDQLVWGGKYILLLKGGRRLLTEMETALKVTVALAVLLSSCAKFCHVQLADNMK
jgi:hypothetical protein